MERQEILELLTQIGVIQHGHFLLTSGRHSDTCMQSAHLFQHPEYSEKLSGALAEQLKGEAIDLVEEAGGVVAAIGVILNRAEGKVDFGVPLYSLIGIDVPSYPANECPQCQQGIALVKPGQANL